MISKCGEGWAKFPNKNAVLSKNIQESFIFKFFIHRSLPLEAMEYSMWTRSITFLLTHWGQDKMAAISRRHFQMYFLEWKCMNFDYNFTEVCSKGPINDIPALVQIMAWRRSGDKPLSEPMMVRLPMHICVTRPQWVNGLASSITKSSANPEHISKKFESKYIFFLTFKMSIILLRFRPQYLIPSGTGTRISWENYIPAMVTRMP